MYDSRALDDLIFSQESNLATETAVQFARDKLDPIANKLWHSEAPLPMDLVQEMAELGFYGITVPEQFGGVGLDRITNVRVTEVLSESLLAAGSIATRNGITIDALLAAGTPEQQAEWLPLLASGKMMTAIAVSEPNAGSDIRNISTTATKDGDNYIINGAKRWVTWGEFATHYTLLAKTGEKEFSMFIIPITEMDKAGNQVTVERINTAAYHGIPTADATFTDFRVPVKYIIGGEKGLGKGFDATIDGFKAGRLQTAGRAAGVALAALTAAFNYSIEREQFGRQIREFQGVNHDVAKIYMAKETTRAFMFRACQLAEDQETFADAYTFASKLHATNMVHNVARKSTEVVGAYAMSKDFQNPRLIMDAEVLHLFEGSANIQRNMIARELFSKEYHEVDESLDYLRSNKQDVRVRSAANAVKRARRIYSGMYADRIGKFGNDLKKQQMLTYQFAEMFIEIEATRSLLHRVEAAQRVNAPSEMLEPQYGTIEVISGRMLSSVKDIASRVKSGEIRKIDHIANILYAGK